jgi:hypothetical protein
MRYDLVERHTAQANGTNTGKVGEQQLFDVVNTLTGETIVSASLAPRADAFAALHAANVNPNATVTYRNSSGSVSTERPLIMAS